MPLWVPQKGKLLVQHNMNGVSAATPGTAVTTGAAAGTKGTPAQIFATTNFDVYWLSVFAANYAASAVACQGAMDILVGSATERILIPDLLIGHAGFANGVTSGHSPKRWDFPLYIPAGTRVAVQASGARVSTAFHVWMYLYGGDGVPPFRVGSKVTTYGMGASSRGTAITPGASGAEGAWAQIVAATDEDHFAVSPSFQPETDTTINARNHAVDIAIGASGQEEMIAEAYWFLTDAGEACSGPSPSMPCFCDIPGGTRLSMRDSNSGTNDTAYGGVLHCVS